MATVEDYVARIEGTCGEEKDVIVIFKYDKKDEAIANIFKKAQLKNHFAGIIFELAFQELLFPRLLKRKSHLQKHQEQRSVERYLNRSPSLDYPLSTLWSYEVLALWLNKLVSLSPWNSRRV